MSDAPAAVLPDFGTAFQDAMKGFLPLAGQVRDIFARRSEADASDRRIADILAGMNIERADGRPDTWPDGVPPSRTRKPGPRPAGGHAGTRRSRSPPA